MSDQITVANEALKPFAVAPEGQSVAVCCDVVDLGEAVDRYQDQPARIVKKAAIVFQLAGDPNPDTGKPFEASVEKTVTFGPKSGLRAFLGAWRGKSYSDAEAVAGIPLHKLEGVCAVLSIEHKVSGAGRTYAKVLSAMPLVKGLPKIAARDYTRSAHWEKKRAEYAAEVDVLRKSSAIMPSRPIAEVLSDAEEDSALPF